MEKATATQTVSTDIAAITDLVMLRQLIPVERAHAEHLVKMILECAHEAATTGTTDNADDVQRASVMIMEADTRDDFGRGHIVVKKAPVGSSVHMYTEPLDTEEGAVMFRRLQDMVGRRAYLGISVRDLQDGRKTRIVVEAEAV